MTAFALVLCACAALALYTRLRLRDFARRWPPRGAFAEGCGARIHFIRKSPPGAARATILLIHGASGNLADMAAPLGERLLAQGFAFMAVDRPGHGYSDRLPTDAASPAAQARAIRAAAEAAGIREAIVVGHSWAGAVAAAFALDHADFCRGAVLLAPVTHPWPRGVRWYYRLAATPVIGWLFVNTALVPAGLAMMDGAMAGVFAPQRTPPDYGDIIGAPLALRPKTFRANAADVVELSAHLARIAPRLPGIAIPVAVLSGDHDGVVLTERHSYGCQRDIPGATLKMLQGVGHSPHWADPEATIAVIEQVAARVQTAREMRPDTPSSAPATSSQ